MKIINNIKFLMTVDLEKVLRAYSKSISTQKGRITRQTREQNNEQELLQQFITSTNDRLKKLENGKK